MSTMALQLPSSFVDVEREEMEYVDGGLDPWSIVVGMIIEPAINKIVGRVISESLIGVAIEMAGDSAIAAVNSAIALAPICPEAAAPIALGALYLIYNA
jgi:hypothetical protein